MIVRVIDEGTRGELSSMNVWTAPREGERW